MPQIKVYFPLDKKTKDRDKRTLFWYDLLYRKMEEFQGSRLIFDYVEEKYVEREFSKNIKFDDATETEKLRFKTIKRNKPRVVVDKDAVETSCKVLLDNWFDTYSNYNDTTVEKNVSDTRSTTFEVDDKELEQFVEDLDRNKFRYQVL